MIRSEREFETVLDEVIGIIRGKHSLDEPGDARLSSLLEAIGTYRSSADLKSEHPLRRRLDDLATHLEDFQNRWAQEHPDAGAHWSTERGFIFPG